MITILLQKDLGAEPVWALAPLGSPPACERQPLPCRVGVTTAAGRASFGKTTLTSRIDLLTLERKEAGQGEREISCLLCVS